MEQIIFVTISMAGGGTERVISTLANHYIDNGYNVTILMIGGGEIAYNLDDRIDICQLSDATNGSIAARVRRINRLRRSVSQYRNPYVIGMGTVASMFASLATIGVKCRLILAERNDPNRLNHRPIRTLEKFFRNVLYIRADKLVFQTEMAKDCFPKYIQTKSEIILNPISKKLLSCSYGGERKKRIVYAGRLTEQKNPLLLLEAFKDFSEKNLDYELFYYGEGELSSYLEEQICHLNLSDKVKVCGRSDNLFDVFLNSEIFVSCSNWEGISNSLIEAVALGMKVIATDCPMGGSRMILQLAPQGSLITPGAKMELTSELFRWTGESDSIKENDIREFRESLNVNKIAIDWLNL